MLLVLAFNVVIWCHDFNWAIEIAIDENDGEKDRKFQNLYTDG
jgi:hypothetical protein